MSIFYFFFSKINQILEIETTRNCESTNKLANAKTATFYLQNCDLWKFSKTTNILSFNYLIFFKTMHRSKIPWIKSLRFTIYISVPYFRDLGPIIFFSDSVPLNRQFPVNYYSTGNLKSITSAGNFHSITCTSYFQSLTSTGNFQSLTSTDNFQSITWTRNFLSITSTGNFQSIILAHAISSQLLTYTGNFLSLTGKGNSSQLLAQAIPSQLLAQATFSQLLTHTISSELLAQVIYS